MNFFVTFDTIKMATLFRSGWWRLSSSLSTLPQRSITALRWTSSESEGKEVAVKDGGGLTEYVSPDKLVSRFSSLTVHSSC